MGSVDDLRELTYERHAHHYQPGTLGYYAENIADDLGSLQHKAGRMLARITSKSNSDRGSFMRSSSECGNAVEGEGAAPRRNSKYEARVGRARKALGHAMKKVGSSFGNNRMSVPRRRRRLPALESSRR